MSAQESDLSSSSSVNDCARRVVMGKSTVTTGRFSYGLKNATVHQWDEGASLTIGAFCSFSTSVTILLGGNHRIDWITTYPFSEAFPKEFGSPDIVGHPSTNGDIVIGNDVWVGRGVTIMSGVTVGDGAVLGANATVVKDVEPYSVVGGNPSKFIKMRFDAEIVRRLLLLRWWDLPLIDIRDIIQQISSPPTPELLDSLLEKYRPGAM